MDFRETITGIKGVIFASKNCFWQCCQGNPGQPWNTHAPMVVYDEKKNVFTAHASLIVLASPMGRHTETVDAWNLTTSRVQWGVLSRHTNCNAVSTQDKVYQSATNTHAVPMQFCQMHHTTLWILPHVIPTSCGIQKKCSPSKTMRLIAFAGDLGDVVSRPLPHGILDTSDDP